MSAASLPCPKCGWLTSAPSQDEMRLVLATHFIKTHNLDVGTAKARAEEAAEAAGWTETEEAPMSETIKPCGYCKRKDGTHSPTCPRSDGKGEKRSAGRRPSAAPMRKARKPAPSRRAEEFAVVKAGQAAIPRALEQLRHDHKLIGDAITALEALSG